MTKAEQELFDEKIKGLHALIQANFDVINVDLSYIKKSIDNTGVRVTDLERMTGSCPTVKNIEKRVAKLEKFNWKIVGIYTGATAVMGAIFMIITKLI